MYTIEEIESSFEAEKMAKLFAAKSRKAVLLSLPSGEIALELGADGIWLRFDCDCEDALPYCQAQCCSFQGTVVFSEEIEKSEVLQRETVFDEQRGGWIMQRGSDGACSCLDRSTRTCQIYEERPMTCRQFHCTRGASVRGFKQPNHVVRQNHLL